MRNHSSWCEAEQFSIRPKEKNVYLEVLFVFIFYLNEFYYFSFSYALVDFGLAQSYDAEEEFDIFNEKFVPNKKRLSHIQNENQPKHNMINIRASSSSVKSSATTTLVSKQATLTTATSSKSPSRASISPYGMLSKQPNNKLINFLNEENVKSPLNNSRSFDCNLNLNAESSPPPNLNLSNNENNERSSPLLLNSKQCLISVPRKSVTKTFTTSSSGILASSSATTTTTTTATSATAIKVEKSSIEKVEQQQAIIKSNNHTPTNLSTMKAISSAKSSTPNLQKYYSFQKPSFNFSDNRCNCYNMPFVCEICTTR